MRIDEVDEQGSFDVRIIENGVPIPITLRFDRDWTLLALKPDDPRILALADPAKVKKAQEIIATSLKQMHQWFGRWTVGETRPLDFVIPNPPGTDLLLKTKATLSRIAVIQGHAVAEFRVAGSGSLPVAGVLAPMVSRGDTWLDLTTGMILKSSSTMSWEPSIASQGLRWERESTTTTDFIQSRF